MIGFGLLAAAHTRFDEVSLGTSIRWSRPHRLPPFGDVSHSMTCASTWGYRGIHATCVGGFRKRARSPRHKSIISLFARQRGDIKTAGSSNPVQRGVMSWMKKRSASPTRCNHPPIPLHLLSIPNANPLSPLNSAHLWLSAPSCPADDEFSSGQSTLLRKSVPSVWYY